MMNIQDNNSKIESIMYSWNKHMKAKKIFHMIHWILQYISNTSSKKAPPPFVPESFVPDFAAKFVPDFAAKFVPDFAAKRISHNMKLNEINLWQYLYEKAQGRRVWVRSVRMS